MCHHSNSSSFLLLTLYALSFSTPPTHVSSFCFVRTLDSCSKKRDWIKPSAKRGIEGKWVKKQCKETNGSKRKEEKRREMDTEWVFLFRSQTCVDSLCKSFIQMYTPVTPNHQQKQGRKTSPLLREHRCLPSVSYALATHTSTSKQQNANLLHK